MGGRARWKEVVGVVGVLIGAVVWATLVHAFSETRLLLVCQTNRELRKWSRGEHRDTAENEEDWRSIGSTHLMSLQACDSDVVPERDAERHSQQGKESRCQSSAS
ncbi:unnamed protein product [Arctogadus glacialis]